MSAKSIYLEGVILDLIFKATINTRFASETGSQTHLYLSLHTALPTTSQSHNEANYSGYVRVAVPRSGTHWSRLDSSISPVSPIEFPACTGGVNTITHFSIGVQDMGTGFLLYAGTISPSIAVTEGVIPRLTTASTITED